MRAKRKVAFEVNNTPTAKVLPFTFNTPVVKSHPFTLLRKRNRMDSLSQGHNEDIYQYEPSRLILTPIPPKQNSFFTSCEVDARPSFARVLTFGNIGATFPETTRGFAEPVSPLSGFIRSRSVAIGLTIIPSEFLDTKEDAKTEV